MNIISDMARELTYALRNVDRLFDGLVDLVKGLM